MITTSNQRWRNHRTSYRPKGEPIDTRKYEIATIGREARQTAIDFVKTHHYAGSVPGHRYRVGLYRTGKLVGVAIFGNGPSQNAINKTLPVEGIRADLCRFVLLDDVPANGETWFLAQAFRLLRRDKGVDALLAYSDPEPRYTDDGERVFKGHIGTIYQASNARFVGRGNEHTRYVFADGSVFDQTQYSKLSRRITGWSYVAAKLREYGAPPPPTAPSKYQAWRKNAIAMTTTTIRHPGSLAYVWAFDRTLTRFLPRSLPYLKVAP